MTPLGSGPDSLLIGFGVRLPKTGFGSVRVRMLGYMRPKASPTLLLVLYQLNDD